MVLAGVPELLAQGYTSTVSVISPTLRQFSVSFLSFLPWPNPQIYLLNTGEPMASAQENGMGNPKIKGTSSLP